VSSDLIGALPAGGADLRHCGTKAKDRARVCLVMIEETNLGAPDRRTNKGMGGRISNMSSFNVYVLTMADMK